MKNKKAVMAVLAGLISIIGIGWYSTDKASSAVTDNSSHAGEKDFNQTLRAFGYGEHEIICEQLQLPPLATGAVLPVRK